MSDVHAPSKPKLGRANEAPFMDKYLKKSIMNRYRLRNSYLKSPSSFTWQVYKSERNVCTKLSMLRKQEYFDKLDTKLISDNKTLWNAIKPFFSDKVDKSQKITIIENDEVISDNTKVAIFLNDLNLNIEENDEYIAETRSTGYWEP